MPLSWKRNPKNEKIRKERRQEQINKIVWKLYDHQSPHNKKINKDTLWTTAEKIAKSPLRTAVFNCNRPFIKIEKFIWEPILTWADNQALLSLLGVVGNVGLIIAVGMYIGSEKQRRDTEVLTAWQTLTNAHGQPGNGGRIHALEFLNASPRNQEYDYPGANWRRRASCLWICTWKPESLAGIDLSAEPINTPEPDTQETSPDDEKPNNDIRSVYLSNIQLPGADLWHANLEGADLVLANLEGADLWHVNLEGAFLRQANLEGANLKFANLKGAFLRQANLEGTDLRQANLKGAFLGSASLEGANLRQANLEGVEVLTQEQISQAKLCNTKFPADISLDPNRDCKELGIELEAEN